jgi:hypothetical protein
MAASLKGPQKMNIDYAIDRKIYDDFVRQCSQKGYVPKIVVERLMAKYAETGNI